jgi:hypothetical protein
MEQINAQLKAQGCYKAFLPPSGCRTEFYPTYGYKSIGEDAYAKALNP